jgi:PKD repeat protein
VNEAPIAVASADITSGKAPLSVQFTSTGSSDPDGDVITYSWDFGDGGGGSADSNPTHTYYDPGNYLVNLTVTDEGGLTSTASLDIKVRRSNGKK